MGTWHVALVQPDRLLLDHLPEFKKLLRGGGFLFNWGDLLRSTHR